MATKQDRLLQDRLLQQEKAALQQWNKFVSCNLIGRHIFLNFATKSMEVVFLQCWLRVATTPPQ